MDQVIFERFRDIIHKNSGINLNPQSKSLLVNRIRSLIVERNLKNYSEYLSIIETDASRKELYELIEAVSTNTTYFWRENEHFAILGDILKSWKKEGRRKARLWCAASSTGEEPYTMAMEVLENFNPDKFDVKILATDVNTKVLKTALQGIYSDESVMKLPPDKRKLLTKLDEDEWAVKPELSKLILFKKLNLIEFPYPLKGPLDIIFCRNVMIYFDIETRAKIVAELCRLLAPGGYLFLSLSESLLAIDHDLKTVSTSVYRKI